MLTSFPLESPPVCAARPASDLGLLESLSDTDLALALLERDPRAYRVAWQRFLPLVRGMAGRAFGRGPETEEVVQEIFFCLFRRVHTLRSPVALRAFVMAVATRTLSHERRRRRPRYVVASDSDERAADALRVAADPAASHAFLRFRQLLSRLREREREAFLLHYVQGLQDAEVADVLGVSAPTARRRFTRARKRIDLWASRDAFLADYLDQGRCQSTA